MLRFGRSYKEERIIYLALERISLLSKILEKLNFLIWHHVAVHLGHPSVSWLSVFFRSTKIPLMFGCMLVSCQTWAELVHASFPPPPPQSVPTSSEKKNDHGGCWRWGWGRGAVGHRHPGTRSVLLRLTQCSPTSGQPTLHIANRPQGGIACRLPKWYRATQVSHSVVAMAAACHGVSTAAPAAMWLFILLGTARHHQGHWRGCQSIHPMMSGAWEEASK